MNYTAAKYEIVCLLVYAEKNVVYVGMYLYVL